MKKKVNNKVYKYNVIEMEYKSITYSNGEVHKVEVCKDIHQTNNKLIFYLIILYMKIKGCKYEVLDD